MPKVKGVVTIPPEMAKRKGWWGLEHIAITDPRVTLTHLKEMLHWRKPEYHIGAAVELKRRSETPDWITPDDRAAIAREISALQAVLN